MSDNTAKRSFQYVNPEFAQKSIGLNKRKFYRPFAFWSGVVVVATVVAGIMFSNYLLQSKKDEVLDRVSARNAIQADAKSSVLQTWISGLYTLGKHITDADLVRLFATEMQLNGMENSNNMKKSLLAQLPYMQQVMRDFATQNNLAGAYMINSAGEVYLGSDIAPNLTAQQQAGVRWTFKTRSQTVMPVRIANGGYVLDMMKPVFMLDEKELNPPVVGVLMAQIAVTENLVNIMAEGPLALDGERALLFQNVGENAFEINLSDGATIKPVTTVVVDAVDEPISSQTDGRFVFTRMQQVMGTPFVVVQEFLKSEALAPFYEYRAKVSTVTTLAVATLIASMMASVWYLMGQRNRQRVRIQEQSMNALIKAVEIRDSYLFGHHARMSRLALDLATRLGLSVYDRSTLYYSAQLSSIGKIFIPQEILAKPGNLTDNERWKLQGHVNYTMEVLGDMNFDYPVGDVISQMNERMDGSGYPQALESDEVNMLSRILAVSDVYCALTSPRSYREEKTPEEAVTIMLMEASKYDADVIKALQTASGVNIKVKPTAKKVASKAKPTTKKAAVKKAPAKKTASKSGTVKPKAKVAAKKPATKKAATKTAVKKTIAKKATTKKS